MTPTLQDVSMILGLPIQGEALCMNTASDGWRQQMEALIGMAPPSWLQTTPKPCLVTPPPSPCKRTNVARS